MAVGVLFGLLASACFSLSNLMEKRAVDRMVSISARRTGHMLGQLVASRTWLAGFLIGAVAVLFMVVAYSRAPIAVVQTILGAGLGLLVVASRLYLHEPLRRLEYVGLGVIVVAVVLVSLTLRSAPGLASGNPLERVLVVSAVTLVAALITLVSLRRAPLGDASVAFGVTSGLLYGVAALQAKSAAVVLGRHGLVAGTQRVLLTPYPYVFVVMSVLGLLVFQSGLQRCRIAVVGTITNIVASVYVVAVGMFVYAERFPHDSTLTALRVVGFALVLAGSWVFVAGPATSLTPFKVDGAGSSPEEEPPLR